MKKNDRTALHTMDISELQKKLTEVQKELAQAQLGNKVGKVSITRVTTLRDDVARLKTILKEKEVATK